MLLEKLTLIRLIITLNKTIFETQVFLLGSQTYSNEQIMNIVNKKDEVLKSTANEMKNNSRFFESLSNITGSDSSYYTRKEILKKFLIFILSNSYDNNLKC